MHGNYFFKHMLRGLAISVIVNGLLTWNSWGQEPLDPMRLTKYIDPLPNPFSNLMQPTGIANGVNRYEVSMTQFNQQLHRELPATTVWGYNGSYPGPTFEVRRDQPIQVQWTNKLSDKNGMSLPHLLPIDTTLHGVTSPTGQGHEGHGQPAATDLVRTVPHLHGAIVESRSDGNPDQWFTADPLATANGLGGPAGNSDIYNYANRQSATQLWYHDHALGQTRLNVYAGLAGLYFIRDEIEDSLNLPRGEYEIPLVIQDKSFFSNGQLLYPTEPESGGHGMHGGGGLPDDFPSENSVVPEFLGNTNLVNGKVWPYIEVEPRKYRFRILNGSNSRFYNLQLDPVPDQQLLFNQIGAEGGLLPKRVELNEILLAPAERADVIVDFSAFNPGSEVLLRNLGPDGPFMGHGMGMAANPETTGQVMKFRLVPATGPDTSSLPDLPLPRAKPSVDSAASTRKLVLSTANDEHGRVKFLLDGKDWNEAVTEESVLGTKEVWEFVNTTQEVHPMHLHAAQFEVVNRQGLMPINGQNHTMGFHPEADPASPIIMPDANEAGLKDTVRVNPGEVTRVLVNFEQFAGDYVWHCHVLEHEDYAMMRPLRIVPEPNSSILLGIGILVCGWSRRNVKEIVNCDTSKRPQGFRSLG